MATVFDLNSIPANHCFNLKNAAFSGLLGVTQMACDAAYKMNELRSFVLPKVEVLPPHHSNTA
jgi:hypothetical protein